MALQAFSYTEMPRQYWEGISELNKGKELTTIEELKYDIEVQKKRLAYAEDALASFEGMAENNVYASLEDAGALEEILQHRAFEDCEGAYNCGDPEYEQEFMVAGKVYVARMTFEYNRHDKMYYYIDGSDFSIEEKK